MSAIYTIDARGVAVALGINKHSILSHRAGSINHPLLRDMPAPLMSRPRLVWLVADIEEWLESRRTFRPGTDVGSAGLPEPTRQRGRPRKTAPGRAK